MAGIKFVYFVANVVFAFRVGLNNFQDDDEVGTNSKDERGPSSITRPLELFQRQRWGKF